jgi:phosphotriesterase-related protein
MLTRARFARCRLYHVGQRQRCLPPLILFTREFIPAIRAAGLSEADIRTLFIDNPAKAFSISVRTTRA